MSRYNKDGPLTEKQLARIKQQVAGAHALGGPAYADCKGILGIKMICGPKPGRCAWRRPTATVVEPKPTPSKIETRRKERAQWWQARGA